MTRIGSGGVWLLPTVVAVATALIVGGVGVTIGLLTQQDKGHRSPRR